jgi:hypothetical protein
MLLRDVPVPCGAAGAEVYVEQTATDYQTWFDRRAASHFEITLLADGRSARPWPRSCRRPCGRPVNDPWGLELSGLNYQNGRKNQWHTARVRANGKTERESNFGARTASLNILETPRTASRSGAMTLPWD